MSYYYKLEMVKGDYPKPIWMNDMGSYNVMPTPFKEITKEHFLSLFLTYSAIAQDFRSVHRDQLEGNDTINYRNGLSSVELFWYQNYGLAFADLWYGTYKFYRLGCDHDHVIDIGDRSCYHKVTCKDCGHEWEYDSSD